jgi:hypothetical protein
MTNIWTNDTKGITPKCILIYLIKCSTTGVLRLYNEKRIISSKNSDGKTGICMPKLKLYLVS